MNISDKCEKLKKEHENDKKLIMEEVVLEWNSNMKERNQKKNQKSCHISEEEKKEIKELDSLDMEIQRFEIMEKVSLCQDIKAIYFIYLLSQKIITDENRRKRTQEEKEKRAEFYKIDPDWVID